MQEKRPATATQKKRAAWFNQIVTLISSHELDKAEKELNSFNEFKDAPEYELLYCKILFDRSQLQEALARINGAILRYPNDWRLLDMKCVLSVKEGDISALSSALDQLKLASPPVERLWKFREEVAVLKADFSKAIELLETAIECGDLGVTIAISSRLFLYNCRVRNWERAFHWLVKYFEIDPDATLDVSLLINYLLELSPEDYGEKAVERLRERFPANNTILFAHIRLLLTTGKSDKIPAVIEDNISIINGNTLRSLKNLLSTTDIEVASEWSEQNPEDKAERFNSMRRDGFAWYLLTEGPEKAHNILQYLADETERDACKQLLELIPSISTHRRTLVLNFPKNKGWVIGAGDASIGTVIVFTGMAGRVGVSNAFFDRYLAELNLDAIYLRDTSRNTYLGGVNGLGTTAEEMAEKLIELSPSKPLYCVSFSGGSFGALSCCLNANLKSVVMFSPYTHLFSNNKAHNSASRYLQKQYESVTSDFLAGFESKGPEFPVHLVYGAEDDDCTHHVKRVLHVRNVAARRVERSAHSSLVFDLAVRGQLLPLLKDALGLN